MQDVESQRQFTPPHLGRPQQTDRRGQLLFGQRQLPILQGILRRHHGKLGLRHTHATQPSPLEGQVQFRQQLVPVDRHVRFPGHHQGLADNVHLVEEARRVAGFQQRGLGGSIVAHQVLIGADVQQRDRRERMIQAIDPQALLQHAVGAFVVALTGDRDPVQDGAESRGQNPRHGGSRFAQLATKQPPRRIDLRQAAENLVPPPNDQRHRPQQLDGIDRHDSGLRQHGVPLVARHHNVLSEGGRQTAGETTDRWIAYRLPPCDPSDPQGVGVRRDGLTLPVHTGGPIDQRRINLDGLVKGLHGGGVVARLVTDLA